MSDSQTWHSMKDVVEHACPFIYKGAHMQMYVACHSRVVNYGGPKDYKNLRLLPAFVHLKFCCKGLEWGYDLGLDRYPRHGEDEWPWAQDCSCLPHYEASFFDEPFMRSSLGVRRRYQCVREHSTQEKLKS
eukprot:6475730-Amphidinium_carterae.1